MTVTVRLGSAAYFECIVIGSYNPSVVWLNPVGSTIFSEGVFFFDAAAGESQITLLPTLA